MCASSGLRAATGERKSREEGRRWQPESSSGAAAELASISARCKPLQIVCDALIGGRGEKIPRKARANEPNLGISLLAPLSPPQRRSLCGRRPLRTTHIAISALCSTPSAVSSRKPRCCKYLPRSAAARCCDIICALRCEGSSPSRLPSRHSLEMDVPPSDERINEIDYRLQLMSEAKQPEFRPPENLDKFLENISEHRLPV